MQLHGDSSSVPLTQLLLQGVALFLQVFNVVLLAQDKVGRQSLTSNEQAGQQGETSYLESPLVGPFCCSSYMNCGLLAGSSDEGLSLPLNYNTREDLTA